MLLVPRFVRKVNDPEKPPIENPPAALGEFGDQTAWALLGEPGASKTEAFKKEVKTTGGQYLRITDFIYTEGIEIAGKNHYSSRAPLFGTTTSASSLSVVAVVSNCAAVCAVMWS